MESGEVGSRVGEEEDEDEGVWEGGDDENEKDEDEPVPMDDADYGEPQTPAASSSSQPSTASPSNAVDQAAQHLEKLLTCVCPLPTALCRIRRVGALASLWWYQHIGVS